MYDRDPVSRWSFGRTTLLGDAAHPMLPFGSNGTPHALGELGCGCCPHQFQVLAAGKSCSALAGAGQAILDVESLGECLRAATPATVAAALQRYEAERLVSTRGICLDPRRKRRKAQRVCALRGAQEKANAVVLATRKGGDHMPFGVVSERYGGRILTETPPELRGARAHGLQTA